jgi:hypothetical protein
LWKHQGVPDDELTYSEVADLSTRVGAVHGLRVDHVERDESLFVTMKPVHGEVVSRRKVVFCTWGTGVFSVEFDDHWSWQVFAYDRGDQVEAVRKIVLVADCYLRGAGVEQSVKAGWRSKHVIVLNVDRERIVLQRRD